MAVLKYKDPTSGEWKNLSGYVYLGNDIPVGAICNYSGDNIPNDYLLCDGSSLLRSAYPDLFNAIGTKYGSVDDLHFNLPDLRERVAVGKSGNSPYNTLGNKGGETTHVLTIAEMPSHDHPIAGAASSNSTLYMQNIASNFYANGSPTLGGTSGTWQWSKSIVAQGGNQAHNNMQPYMVLNYIIKAKNSTYTLSKVVNSLNSNSTIDSLSAAQGKILNDKVEGIVVYESTGQSSGVITLTKDISSAKKIKIIYIDEYSVYGEKTIEIPVGKQVGLNTIRNGAASFIFTNLDCTISANAITINSNKKLTMSSGVYSDATTKILKVIEY